MVLSLGNGLHLRGVYCSHPGVVGCIFCACVLCCVWSNRRACLCALHASSAVLSDDTGRIFSESIVPVVAASMINDFHKD